MTIQRPLIQIRERSTLDIMDLALVVVRRRPGPLALAALAGIAPWVALNAWLETAGLLNNLLALLLVFLEAPWATAPLTLTLGGLMFNQPLSAARTLRAIARATPAFLFYHAILRPVLGLMVLPYVLAFTRQMYLNEVLLLERGRIFTSGRRAGILGTRGGSEAVVCLLQYGCGALFIACFWTGSGALLNSLFTSELTWETPEWTLVLNWRFQLGLWLAVAFFAVARFFCYVDQRIRLEGWELKLRLQAVGAAQAEVAPR